MWWLLLASARCEEPVAEEIVVYADDFARWDHTRWLLQSELVLPLPVQFSSDRNEAFESYGFQVRAIVGCEKDAPLGKHRWEVSCELEDVGLLVTSTDRWRRERDREQVQSVLDELDAHLTGARVQMQVDDAGGITDFDLEGIDTANFRQRQMQETVRQLMSRVMAGFHLRIPDHAQRTGTWGETRSEMMDLPSLTASRGTSTLVHGVSPYGPDLRIVQTRGEGVVVVALPNRPQDPWAPPPPELAGAGSTGSAPTSVMEEGESSVDASFALRLEGVAVFRKATGILSERVWTCAGQPTAGAPRNVGPYRNVGRITLLGETDHPDVGPSTQVAWPGRTMEGLPAWVSIETMPEAGPG